MRKCLLATAAILGTLTGTTQLPAADPPDVAAALAAIKAVGREGSGNEQAAAGWKRLVAAGGAALLPTLAAFDDAKPTAANWLRAAVDAIVEGEKKAGRAVPAESLRGFVHDARRNPAARRIAYELYAKIDAATAGRLLPQMIDDPSLEIRRDAITARLTALEAAGGADKEETRRLLRAARDIDQLQQIAAMLEKAGEKIDLPSHLGFITHWQVVGPFDSPNGAGFAAPMPPEKGVHLSATYPGKGGTTVGWKPADAASKDKTYATVDLNAALGKHHDAVGYAFAVVEAEKETPVEVRAGSQNSIQIFVNGAKVFERDEYHHGTNMDQHIGKATLKPGRNEILVKVCQNDEKEEWTQVWGFQLRVCDHLGGPVPVKAVTPTK